MSSAKLRGTMRLIRGGSKGARELSRNWVKIWSLIGSKTLKFLLCMMKSTKRKFKGWTRGSSIRRSSFNKLTWGKKRSTKNIQRPRLCSRLRKSS